MNSLAYGIRAALEALKPLTNNTSFTWTLGDGSTAQVVCVPSSEREANSPISGGFDDTGGVTLYVQFSDWLTADSTLVSVDSTLWTADNDGNQRPVVGRKVTFQGTVYRIVSCVTAAPGSHYELTLASARR